MNMLGASRKRASTGLAAGVFTLMLGLGSLPAQADVTKPYGDNVTGHIANVLHGTHRGGWLATVLDEGGYHGKRHAEEVKIPAGHGRRWVGIIHVPPAKAKRAARALSGVWFARAGARFVLPLRSNDFTNGGTGATYKQSAKWAAKRLGKAWRVVSP
jgi:hypothetical protein